MAFYFSKTEPAMFSPPKTQIDHELKINLNGKKLYQTGSVRNLVTHLNIHLTRKNQINNK